MAAKRIVPLEKYIVVARLRRSDGHHGDIAITTQHKPKADAFAHRVKDRSDLIRLTMAIVIEEIEGPEAIG
jgi:hypothetical protein